MTAMAMSRVPRARAGVDAVRRDRLGRGPGSLRPLPAASDDRSADRGDRERKNKRTRGEHRTSERAGYATRRVVALSGVCRSVKSFTIAHGLAKMATRALDTILEKPQLEDTARRRSTLDRTVDSPPPSVGWALEGGLFSCSSFSYLDTNNGAFMTSSFAARAIGITGVFAVLAATACAKQDETPQPVTALRLRAERPARVRSAASSLRSGSLRSADRALRSADRPPAHRRLSRGHGGASSGAALHARPPRAALPNRPDLRPRQVQHAGSKVRLPLPAPHRLRDRRLVQRGHRLLPAGRRLSAEGPRSFRSIRPSSDP